MSRIIWFLFGETKIFTWIIVGSAVLSVIVWVVGGCVAVHFIWKWW